jgi:hypothetical protein
VRLVEAQNSLRRVISMDHFATRGAVEIRQEPKLSTERTPV